MAPAATAGSPYSTTTALTTVVLARVPTTRSLNPTGTMPPTPPHLGVRSTVYIVCSSKRHRPRVVAVRPRCHPSLSLASLSAHCATRCSGGRAGSRGMPRLERNAHTSSYNGSASARVSITAVEAHSRHSARPSGSSANSPGLPAPAAPPPWCASSLSQPSQRRVPSASCAGQYTVPQYGCVMNRTDASTGSSAIICVHTPQRGWKQSR
mmetsp:Transcript_18197/g.45241  ORF Transcript_18197/g.45241 Transcript_18197/m.45241 type:complete len:209 (-) Transcript_18197:225-851(-)